MPEDRFWVALAGRPVDMKELDRLFLQYHRPVQPMLEVAAKLRARGVRTAILSNTQASHARLMHKMGFLSGFDPLLFSYDIGTRKPGYMTVKDTCFREELRRDMSPGRCMA